MIVADYEVIATNYPHPTITTGQHTNGPARIWVKKKGGDWINTGETRLRKIMQKILDGEDFG